MPEQPTPTCGGTQEKPGAVLACGACGFRVARQPVRYVHRRDDGAECGLFSRVVKCLGCANCKAAPPEAAVPSPSVKSARLVMADEWFDGPKAARANLDAFEAAVRREEQQAAVAQFNFLSGVVDKAAGEIESLTTRLASALTRADELQMEVMALSDGPSTDEWTAAINEQITRAEQAEARVQGLLAALREADAYLEQREDGPSRIVRAALAAAPGTPAQEGN